MKRRRMTDAERLRAQIPSSTDPARLERMAREAEARARAPRGKEWWIRIAALVAALAGIVIGYVLPGSLL